MYSRDGIIPSRLVFFVSLASAMARLVLYSTYICCLVAIGLGGCTDSLVPKPGSTPLSRPGSPAPSKTAELTTATPSPSSISLAPSNPTLSASPSLVPTPSSSNLPQGGNYQVINEQRQPQFMVDGRQMLSSSNWPQVKVTVQAEAMLTVMRNTRTYLQKNAIPDPVVSMAGVLGTQGVTVADTLRTLDFAIATLEEDMQAKRPSRLQDSNFLSQNFRVLKWRAQNPQKKDQEQIRITKYAVFTHPASKVRTDVYNTALYQLKDGLAPAPTYTKQEVLSGIYEPGGKATGQVEPIAYLTREGLEEALMEGTILLKFTDGTQGLFNVDRSNNIAYVKGLDREKQKRYWYFQPVQKIKGYGYTMIEKIEVEPGVTFAGDVLNIGLGKLVAVGNGGGMRLGVVADTGGAFLPNLYQLDFLAGVFASQEDFTRAARAVPEYADVYFLIKK